MLGSQYAHTHCSLLPCRLRTQVFLQWCTLTEGMLASQSVCSAEGGVGEGGLDNEKVWQACEEDMEELSPHDERLAKHFLNGTQAVFNIGARFAYSDVCETKWTGRLIPSAEGSS